MEKEIIWKEFKVTDLFKVRTTTGVDKNKVVFKQDGKYDFIGRTSVNWGVQGKTDRMSFAPNAKNTFSLVQVGETIALWRVNEWYASQNLFILEPLYDEIVDSPLFFQAVINASMKKYGSGYNSYPTLMSLRNEIIFLPVKKDGTPDWDYMAERIRELEAERIRELEAERIRELEAYLLATGLNDYELTEEDKQVLVEMSTGGGNSDPCGSNESVDGLRWKEFKIGELFDVINNPQLDKENFVFSESASYSYFTRTENNNGIFGYVEYLDAKHKIKGNSLAVGMISMKFHYMSHDFYAGQFTKTLIPKFKGFNEILALFFIGILNKYSFYYQSYLVREFVSRVKNTACKLPVRNDGQPDWGYMERYIRAIEKLVIADVVKWKDQQIKVTKNVVNKGIA